jgi:hypothetical protein
MRGKRCIELRAQCRKERFPKPIHFEQGGSQPQKGDIARLTPDNDLIEPKFNVPIAAWTEVGFHAQAPGQLTQFRLEQQRDRIARVFP